MSLLYPIHLKIRTWLYIQLLFFPIFAQTSIVDTLYTVNILQGVLGKSVYSGVVLGGVATANDGSLSVGDYYDQAIYNESITIRAFISFEISSIPSNYQIDSAYVYIYQEECFNNNINGVFPNWNCTCNLYHVDYGYTLDYDDFEPTEFSMVGAVSSDNVDGWKRIDVTSSYIQDLIQNRQYNQYLIKFPLITDYDYAIDGVDYASSYSLFPEHLVIYYSPIIENSDEMTITINDLSLYPNPCRRSFIVSLKQDLKLLSIEIINVKGQKIHEFDKFNVNGREHRINFNTKDITTGLYIIKSTISQNNQVIVKTNKILVR